MYSSLVAIPKWAINCTNISIGLTIFLLALTLLISFFDLVIPNIQKRFPKHTISIIFVLFYFGLGTAASIAWIDYLLKNDLFLILEFKISLLILVIAILIILSVSLKSSSQFLENLIEVRRDLILHTLPIDQIRNQTELILRGLSVQDYYSKDINEVLASLQLFDKELFQAIQKINLYQNNEIINLENKEKNLIQDALKESILRHLVIAAKIKFSQIDIAKKRLTKKRGFLKGFNKALKKDFTDREIVSEVFDATIKNIGSFNDTVKVWYQLINKTIGHESAQNMILELCQNVPKLKYNIKTGDIEE